MAGSSRSAAKTTTLPEYNAGDSGPSEGHWCYYRRAEGAAGTDPSPTAHNWHRYQCVPLKKKNCIPGATVDYNTHFLVPT